MNHSQYSENLVTVSTDPAKRFRYMSPGSLKMGIEDVGETKPEAGLVSAIWTGRFSGLWNFLALGSISK